MMRKHLLNQYDDHAKHNKAAKRDDDTDESYDT